MRWTAALAAAADRAWHWSQDPIRRKRVWGVAFVIAVAVIWVGSSFLVQGIEQDGANPFVLTFVANSLFAVFLPLYWLNLRLGSRLDRAAQREHELDALVAPAVPRSDGAGAGGAALESGEAHEAHPMLPWRQLARASLVVAPLWYCAQLTFNASLALTSVTSNTILSSTSSLFTFLLSVAVLHEAFTRRKLACILLLIAGTAMVTVADSRSGGGGPSSGKNADGGAGADRGGHSVLGDLLCLLSSCIYACYTVAIRKMLHDDEEVSTALFFGLMGCLIFFGAGPLLLLALALGAPLGSLSWRLLGLMVAKGLAVNVLSDYLWARSILLVGPTVATSGLAMQVPLAVAADVLFTHPSWLAGAGSAALTLVGGAVVLAGFVWISLGGGAEEGEPHPEVAEWDAAQSRLVEQLGGSGGSGGSPLRGAAASKEEPLEKRTSDSPHSD